MTKVTTINITFDRNKEIQALLKLKPGYKKLYLVDELLKRGIEIMKQELYTK